MPTPTSSSYSYCTPAQALLFFDNNLLGELVNDDGTVATSAELLTDPKLQAALEAASGEVERAAFVGGKYTPEALQALTGVSAVGLAQIVAWLAIPMLMGRRNPTLDKYPEIAEAKEAIQQIRRGETIFGLIENQEAGLPSQVSNTNFNTKPLTSSPCRAGRFFGIRGWEMGRTCGCGN